MTTLILFMLLNGVFAQGVKVKPSSIKKPVYFDISLPLVDIKEDTDTGNSVMDEEIERNPKLKYRDYPFRDIALPKGNDPVWQKRMGKKYIIKNRDINVNFEGQNTTINPPDCNGTVGPNHYMQTINAKYTIYDKSGNLLAGPTNMNTLFEGVAGADKNDGDPIIMYDDKADRWLAAEFSGVNSDPDYMLIAVSETNDPTGSWYRWSYEMNGFPDYMKFGVWRDGYYMGVNANGSNDDDIYVFERDKMIVGDANPQMVAFDNPNRPNSGFHVVLPMDNDGDFAPTGTPGQFITINDDAWGNGGDELWIFELDVDWSNTSNSTFQRVQTLSVSSFDSDFGSDWENIAQKGTDQELDAIPQILMHRAQYRNFGDHQTVMCVHTVDVDDSDHAGLRWYELENTGGGWSIRQQGTYAPDADSRWMGSIAMNGNKDIGIGYSVSSSNTYPSIRYTGQSSDENANATGVLDIVEESIQVGAASQTSTERWGDYANLSLDPNDDNTFWFTTEYNKDGSNKGTRIASFSYAPPPLTADFTADKTEVCSDETVSFTDRSSGSPTSWSWSFNPDDVTYVGGTSSTSQNPQVQFNSVGTFDVSLTVANASENDTETKNSYVSVSSIIADFSGSPLTINEGESVTFSDESRCSPTSWDWTFQGGEPATYSGQNPPAITYSVSGNYDVTLEVSNSNGNSTETKSSYVTVNSPDILMQDGDKTTCSASFYDSGDNTSDYSDDEDFTLTVYPADSTKVLQIDFTSFDVELDSDCANDYLEIYDGSDVNATLIGAFCGTDSPGTITSTSDDGSLTFYFKSDNPFFSNSTESGWESKFSCKTNANLPLSFVIFKGEAKDDFNILYASTFDERAIFKYIVEKSIDGIHFIKFKEVQPISNGNNEKNQYSIKDINPENCLYYRVKAIDFDGGENFSKIIQINRDLDFEIVKMYPVPAKNKLFVNYTNKGSEVSMFKIYNMAGRLVKMQKFNSINGSNSAEIDLSMFRSGKYILKLEINNITTTKIFVKE